MAEVVQKITHKLFTQPLDEKIVRDIRKETELLLPDVKRLLIAEVITKVRSSLAEDDHKTLITVKLVCTGCPTLHESLAVCLEEIILACTHILHTLHTEDYSNHLCFNVAAKALHGMLQYVLPKIFHHLEKPKITNLLETVYFSLFLTLTSDKLPSEYALVIAMSFNITLAYLKSENVKAEFFSILFAINKLGMNKIQKDSKHSVEEIFTLRSESLKFQGEKFRCVKPSRLIVLLLHGLFNSGVQWIYNEGSWHDINTRSKATVEECPSTCQHSEQNAVSLEYAIISHAQTQMQKDDHNEDDGNIFLYEIYSLIKSLCKGAATFTFQAFQVLQVWLSSVRKLGSRIQQDSSHVWPGKAGKGQQDFIPNNHPSGKLIFAVQSTSQDTVFHLLNSNWENPSKGVSDVVYSCMVELLELHEDGVPGRAKDLATGILAALVSSAAWSSKSTYPPLALAISYVTPREALALQPTLPAGLVRSLSVNHLAPAGAAVYKMILGQLVFCLWFEYFFIVVCEALHGDRLTQQHVLSLWLPTTLHHYPDLHIQLLSACQDTTAGWVARMAILRVARSLGIFSLKEHDGALNQMAVTSYEKKLITANKVQSNIKEFSEIMENFSSRPMSSDDDDDDDDDKDTQGELSSLSVMSYIESAVNHLNEAVRGEALSLLCNTQKTSQPVSLEESNYIKLFFKFNMNIDSMPFRQNIKKCYKALIVRLRDASAAELKKLSFRATTVGDCSTEFLRKYKASPVLKVNIELVVWFIKLFHYNLAIDGNYQRRILSLQLLKETLLAFYEKKNSLTYSLTKRYMTVCTYINLTSENIIYHENVQNSQQVTDLTLPCTLEMLLFSCMDEMDDIRQEAEYVLEILKSSHSVLSFTEAEKWLRLGLTLCNSARSSEAESGAVLLKVISSLCCNTDHDVSTLLKTMDLSFESGNLINFLFVRVEKQFLAAQKSLLEAARCAPLHGSLLVSFKGAQAIAVPFEDMQDILQRLTDLMVQMVEFMLSKLACVSPNGSAIAPSFAEMGAAVEVIIKECEGSLEEPPGAQPATSHGGHEDTQEQDEDNYEDNSLSEDHMLILSCCWQTLKICCTVSSMCVSQWLNYFSEVLLEKVLRSVVVRVLTGTRHKGAIEGARTAYSQICQVLLNTNSKIGQLVYKQVREILDQLREGVRTSVTRRAAGMAMMIQAACGAAPQTNALLINETIISLLSITETEYEEKSTTDSPPVLALHVLHSLVSHAPLAYHLMYHIPAITATCLQAFTTDSWALRNAALQLYAAAVPRMVGQKKVREDSSTLNSLTAPEFLFRHPVLVDSLLHLLSNSEDARETHQSFSHFMDMKMKERTGCKNEQLSIKISSSIVPVLSLVARLSPGTELQQNKELNDTLSKFCQVTNRLLGSPVYTIRRLSSLAIVALTPVEQTHFYINNILHVLRIPEVASTNMIHGNLFALKSFLQTYPKLIYDQHLKDNIVATLSWLMEANNKCPIIDALVLNIFILLQVSITVDMKPLDPFQPGMAEYLQNFTTIKIEHNFKDTVEKVLLSEHELEDPCIEHVIDSFKIHSDGSWRCKIEALLWQRLEDKPIIQRALLPIMKLLCALLEFDDSLNCVPSEKCIKKLLILLQGCYGTKAASLTLVVIAHIFNKLQDNQWFGNEVKSDMFFAFSKTISLYSEPASTDDYRLAASKALKISVKGLLYFHEDVDSAYKELLIVACTKLLQDEDSNIRDSACQIVFSFLDSDHANERNISKQTLLDMKNFSWQPHSKVLLHPNLALLEFAKIIVRRCVCTSDWSMLRVIWKICSGQYNCNFSLLYMSKSSLFESHTMNSYEEPKQLSQTLAKAMLDTLAEAPATVVQNSIPNWLQEEGEILNKNGEILGKLASQQTQLATQKKLFTATSIHIIALETLLSLGNIFNIPVNLSSPITWNSSCFCTLLDIHKEYKGTIL
ncbi:tRNA (32-2'-O)-methyltransferase regulator THADA-like isoform X2 [Cherax quadricarinatus]|uniref:tRNA (32-2'-O)-methyltransferase regulator THADA-like isoform X2 n=1 Tax=Cherax quadricarinatus TaxID=27406 RepID=UPI00387E4AC2